MIKTYRAPSVLALICLFYPHANFATENETLGGALYGMNAMTQELTALGAPAVLTRKKVSFATDHETLKQPLYGMIPMSQKLFSLEAPLVSPHKKGIFVRRKSSPIIDQGGTTPPASPQKKQEKVLFVHPEGDFSPKQEKRGRGYALGQSPQSEKRSRHEVTPTEPEGDFSPKQEKRGRGYALGQSPQSEKRSRHEVTPTEEEYTKLFDVASTTKSFSFKRKAQ